MHACRRTHGMSVCKLWRAGKRGQRSRHTLDAPALEYVPASQEVHVADELAPVALEYVPATQSVHSEAPAVQAQRQTARSSVILRYKRMRAVVYARCIALFVLLVPALRTPAVIPLALAASRIRACMQQDATGSLMCRGSQWHPAACMRVCVMQREQEG